MNAEHRIREKSRSEPVPRTQRIASADSPRDLDRGPRVLALQMAAGNTAVARALARQPVQRDPDKPTSAAHAGGTMGELDAAFGLGEKGFDIIMGPAGEGGHKLTAHGFDMVAYHPGTGELWIVDNKASGGTSTAQKASAITENLIPNTEKAIGYIEKLQDFPHKKAVLAQLQATKNALGAGHKLPAKVSLVITNAGGYHSGIAKKLKDLGVKFEDLTGKAVRDVRKADIRRARKAGVALGRPTTVPSPDLPAASGNGSASRPQSPAVKPPVGNVSSVSSSTSIAVSDMAKAENLRAKAAARSLTSDLRTLRGGRWLGRLSKAVGVVGVFGSLMDFAHFTDIASSKLSGGAFIHGKAMKQALRLEAQAEQLPGEYEGLSEAIYDYELNDSLWQSSEDQWTALRSSFSLLLLRYDIVNVRTDIRLHKQRIDRMLKNVEGRLKAAEKVLASPGTWGTLGMGSSILAEIFGASQDFQQIAGSLRSASESMDDVIRQIDEDLGYIDSWLKVLVAAGLGTYSPT